MENGSYVTKYIYIYIILHICKVWIGLPHNHFCGARLILPAGGPMNNSISTSEFSLLSGHGSFCLSSFDSFREYRPCWKIYRVDSHMISYFGSLINFVKVMDIKFLLNFQQTEILFPNVFSYKMSTLNRS